ncbi:MAG: KH domain-containing protein [Defluviitaleaceae bacterium]|nr:KH domain-containing protein [Defluviitaleaceae bacterium]
MEKLKITLEVIAKSVVSLPQEVFVTPEETDEQITLTIETNPEDIGRIIGKKGAVIHSIRTVLRAASYGIEKRINVEIKNETPRGPISESAE